MDPEITLVSELLDERRKHININASTGGGGVGVRITDLEAFKDKWKGQHNEFSSQIDGMDVFAGGGWFRSQMECVDFEEITYQWDSLSGL